MVNKKKSLLILLLSAIFLVSTCFAITVMQNKAYIVDAKTIQIQSAQINDFYSLNNKVVFPLTLDVEYEGESYTTDKGIVYFPNGKIIDVNAAGVLLDVKGLYQIKYAFKTDDGKLVNATKNITVTDSLYNFSVNNGSSFVVANASETPALNNNSDVLFSREEGLIVKLNDGASFIYNKPINLVASGDESTAEIIRLDARLVDVSYDSEAKEYKRVGLIAEELKIKLTDCYNSMNNIEIIVDVIGSSVYFRVRTATSAKSYGLLYNLPTDLETNNNNKEVYIDDLRGVAYFDNYGTYFTGYEVGKSGTELFGYTLTYDYELNRVYYEYNGKKVLICDLMNTTMFDEDDFTPFTTGEVYLSMTASGYKKTVPARVDILSIGGEKIMENQKLDDAVAPKIDINIDYTENNVVYIAKNDTFYIPSANVVDVNYNGKMNVDVYRNYGNQNQTLVCSNAKSFVANVADTYSVVYTAMDSYGNRSVKVLDVVAVKADKSLSLEVEKLDVAYFGEENVLPEFNVLSVNGSKKVSVEITAEFNGEIINVDTQSRIFKPRQLGTYKITYKFNDNLFTDEYSYNVDVEERSDVVFIDDVVFNDYVIKNAVYRILPVSAYVKTANGYSATAAEGYVSFDGGEFVKVSDIDKVKIEAESTVDVKFMYQGVSSKIFRAKVVDVGFGDTKTFALSKYFLGDFSVLKYDSNGKIINNIAFQSNVESGDNAIKFINNIDYTQFKLEYRTAFDLAKYQKLNIKLSDANDSDKVFVITVRQGSNNAAFISLNGGKEYLSTKKFAGEFVNSINYNGNLKVLNINGIKFSVDMGFESIYASLEIELEGIYGEAAFTIVKINNTTFDNSFTSDSSLPEVNINKSYGQYEINNVLNIKTPIITDILSPINYDTVKFRIVGPNQHYVTTIDDIVLDGSQEWRDSFDIKLSQYGFYTVSYEGLDYSNAKCSGQYRFEVKDKISPEIVIKNNYSESNPMRVGVGRVSFNYTVSEEATIMINLMNNKTMAIEYNVGQSFIVYEKGEYTVFVYAVDKDSNSCCKTFKLIVN